MLPSLFFVSFLRRATIPWQPGKHSFAAIIAAVKLSKRLKKMSSGQESLLFELEQVLDGLRKTGRRIPKSMV